MTTNARTRNAALHALLRTYGRVCVGYSGGVDSTYLVAAAADALGRHNVLALTGLSASVPESQQRLAQECAHHIGVQHIEVHTLELQDPRYAANPVNRCYYCKAELWTRLLPVALDHGFSILADGTNADDATDHRPGARAGAEAGVCSPLLEAGLTKADIRLLSRERGLPTWDAPSAPCLSSRIAYGIAVTPERLRAIECAESGLRALGFRELRVRHHGDCARIELAPQELGRARAQWRDIRAAAARAGFTRVLLDVDGYRRGALNEAQALVQIRAAV